jgi:hypothetical protein
MMRFALLTLLSALALAGCTIYQNPKIAFGDATPAEMTDEAMRIDVLVDLVNPNQEPLDLIRFSYRFVVDGRTLFEGRRAAQATLSARGERRLTLPVIIRFEDVDWDAGSLPESLDWSISGSLLYLTPGELAEILLDLGVRKPTARFRGRGNLSLAARDDAPGP